MLDDFNCKVCGEVDEKLIFTRVWSPLAPSEQRSCRKEGERAKWREGERRRRLAWQTDSVGENMGLSKERTDGRTRTDGRQRRRKDDRGREGRDQRSAHIRRRVFNRLHRCGKSGRGCVTVGLAVPYVRLGTSKRRRRRRIEQESRRKGDDDAAAADPTTDREAFVEREREREKL